MTAPPATKAFTVPLRTGKELDFTGRLLGSASSWQREHRPHDGEHAPVGLRCSACRWIELEIYAVDQVLGQFDPDADQVRDNPEDPPARYLVHKRGMSNVEGEIELFNNTWIDRGLEVVRAMVYKDALRGANRDAVAAAARHDPDIAKAYALW